MYSCILKPIIGLGFNLFGLWVILGLLFDLIVFLRFSTIFCDIRADLHLHYKTPLELCPIIKSLISAQQQSQIIFFHIFKIPIKNQNNKKKTSSIYNVACISNYILWTFLWNCLVIFPYIFILFYNKILLKKWICGIECLHIFKNEKKREGIAWHYTNTDVFFYSVCAYMHARAGEFRIYFVVVFLSHFVINLLNDNSV